MKALAIAFVATTAMAFGALAQTQQQNVPAAQSQPTTSSSTPARSPGANSDTRAAPRSSDINVRANIRAGSDRTLVRERSRSPAIVYSRSRTRYVSTVDDRPSRVTVI